MYFDFALMSSDQISNQAAKWHYMRRSADGSAIGHPLFCRRRQRLRRPTFTDAGISILSHPGLYVVYPTTPYDAKGMLKSAIRDNNPIMFVESQALYGIKGPVPEGEYLVPLASLT